MFELCISFENFGQKVSKVTIPDDKEHPERVWVKRMIHCVWSFMKCLKFIFQTEYHLKSLEKSRETFVRF